MEAQGSGTIEVMCFNGLKWNKKQLLNVLFVPGLPCNLFSGTRALDRDFKLRNENGIAAIGICDGKLVQNAF